LPQIGSNETRTGNFTPIVRHEWVPDAHVHRLADANPVATGGDPVSGRQLLMFNRQQLLDPRVLDLNEVLTDLSKMTQRLLREDIELTLIADPALGQVRADQGSLEQLVVNLVVNARDAMPTGGKLTLETSNVTLDPAYAHITRASIAETARLRALLAEHDVHSVGRYGGWTYCSIEDNLIETRALATSLRARGS